MSYTDIAQWISILIFGVTFARAIWKLQDICSDLIKSAVQQTENMQTILEITQLLSKRIDIIDRKES